MPQDQDRVQSDPMSVLRRRAKARKDWETMDFPELGPEDAEKLLHELRTHQIEVEMQNEELLRAQEELVESRDRYSDLYDFAPVGYVTISAKGLILEANLTLAKMLGVDRGELEEHPLSAFFIQEDQDIWYLHHRRIRDVKQRAVCRLRMVRRGSEPLWVEMDSIPIAADESGVQLRTVISDITERKKEEAERLELERRLQHAQKLESLGVLAGGVAHDFNNLLMAITGNADLALEKLKARSPARVHLEEIEKASKRATELANQMLAYSGKGRAVVEAIDLGKLVEEMETLLEVSISTKVVIKLNLAENLPVFTGDVTQVRQVVMNLITNASEAIGEAVGVITLSTRAIECDRAYLEDFPEPLRAGLDEPLPEGVYSCLEVTDTGCGMSAGTVERIFDPFFTTKFMGRGLGMSAVLGILRGHRGALKIHSEVGAGTTVKVLFSANEPPAQVAAILITDTAEAKDWRGRGTVLVADDEQAVRLVTKQMLERIGFNVLTAPDGYEALQTFREHADEIVCVLLDLTMPRMDGNETLREMRRLHPGVSVVLCSGYCEKDAVQQFGDESLAAFIQKPYDPTSLKAKLMEVLHRPGEPTSGIT